MGEIVTLLFKKFNILVLNLGRFKPSFKYIYMGGGGRRGRVAMLEKMSAIAVIFANIYKNKNKKLNFFTNIINKS